MNNDQLLRQIDRYEYISFDIFDTLVFRNVQSYVDIFKYVEFSQKFKGFCKKRCLAEKIVNRLYKDGSATLDNIYNFIKCEEKQKKILYEAEIEAEKNFIYPNMEIKKIFDRCVECGKHVVLISDMYLEKLVIEDILCECGYQGYKKIFISCEYGKSKGTGSLFKVVLENLDIKETELLHIGDNRKSDYTIPTALGIKSFHYIPKKISINNYKPDNIALSILKSLFQKSERNATNEEYVWGYLRLGPLLFFLAKWIVENLSLFDGKIGYLAREGLLVKKAVELVSGKVENNYLLVSRRSITPVALYYTGFPKSWNELTCYLPISKKTTLRYLLDMFGDDYSKYFEYFDAKTTTDTFLTQDAFNIIKSKLYPKFIIYSKEQKSAFETYLKNKNMSNITSIFDLSGNGTLQKRFEQILNKNIIGLYLYVEEKNFYNLKNRRGYLNQKVPGSQKYNTNKIESMIWTVTEAIRCVKEIDIESKYKKYPVIFVARGLSNVLIELSSKYCVISKKEKMEYFEELRYNELFTPYFNIKYVKEVFNYNKKWGIVLGLFSIKFYEGLLVLMEFYRGINIMKKWIFIRGKK